ncbi:hypothetical protein E6Q11_04345 [Candidatus Dojkabacteria bacterium]|uniref:Uncharacterized protein n=1 Tax=Candidatus Dojkabacteria bacterium TaxID=2099670 RepID=A0A5C7J6Q1_9BACT|nr:MAG: hypothetical protein E6Q11_04345 [Candidatus Dojkabacteria bacterium]
MANKTKCCKSIAHLDWLATSINLDKGLGAKSFRYRCGVCGNRCKATQSVTGGMFQKSFYKLFEEEILKAHKNNYGER